MISKYGNSALVQMATVFEPVYHVACQRIFWNGTFCTYILPRFPECLISEINQLWGSYLFWKCSKFKVDFENGRKYQEKAFYFWDNYVRNGCVKLSVLRREYLPSEYNVLTNSYKSLRLTTTDFFRLNYLPNDQ